MSIGPITQGADFNFFQKVTVSSATFGTQSDVVFNFKGRASFTFSNEGSGVIEYSFNGTNLHGDMTPGTASAALSFDNRQGFAVWFRLKSGASSIVRVEAWASV
ncbi:MAG TPA: hypothetical protein VM577_18590 [Anaerovoracaceae bacterium]|nr:hypothetical protein [Anaerovoracaceae bacterium]